MTSSDENNDVFEDACWLLKYIEDSPDLSAFPSLHSSASGSNPSSEPQSRHWTSSSSWHRPEANGIFRDCDVIESFVNFEDAPLPPPPPPPSLRMTTDTRNFGRQAALSFNADLVSNPTSIQVNRNHGNVTLVMTPSDAELPTKSTSGLDAAYQAIAAAAAGHPIDALPTLDSELRMRSSGNVMAETFLPDNSGFFSDTTEDLQSRNARATSSLEDEVTGCGVRRTAKRCLSESETVLLNNTLTMHSRRYARETGTHDATTPTRALPGRRKTNEKTGSSISGCHDNAADDDDVIEYRILRRREQNRRAARVCRERKRAMSVSMHKEYEELLSSNNSLHYEIRKLLEEESSLASVLNDHLQFCSNNDSFGPASGSGPC